MCKWFEDSYKVVFVLKDEHDVVYKEEYDGMSLSDFEVLYGAYSDEIIECHLTIEKEELTDDE